MRVRLPTHLLWQIPLCLWSIYYGYHYGGYYWLYPIGIITLFIIGVWIHNNRGEVDNEGPNN